MSASQSIEELIRKIQNARRNSYFLYVLASSQEQRLLTGFMPDEATLQLMDGLLEVLGGDDSLFNMFETADEEQTEKMRIAFGDQMLGVMQKVAAFSAENPDWTVADLYQVASEAGIVL